MPWTHVHAHGVGLLLNGCAFVFFGDPETFAMKPVVDVPAVDVVALLDALTNGEGGHLDSAWFDIALQLRDYFWSETDGEAVGIDTSSGGGIHGRRRGIRERVSSDRKICGHAPADAMTVDVVSGRALGWDNGVAETERR